MRPACGEKRSPESYANGAWLPVWSTGSTACCRPRGPRHSCAAGTNPSSYPDPPGSSKGSSDPLRASTPPRHSRPCATPPPRPGTVQPSPFLERHRGPGSPPSLRQTPRPARRGSLQPAGAIRTPAPGCPGIPRRLAPLSWQAGSLQQVRASGQMAGCSRQQTRIPCCRLPAGLFFSRPLPARRCSGRRGKIEVKELEAALAKGIAEASVFPVLCGSGAKLIGIDRLAHFIVEEGPAPKVSDGQPVAFVFKTIVDPYVGRVNL